MNGLAILLIIVGVLCCYLAAWLYTARALYGRWRANGIDKTRRNLSISYPTTAAAIDYWNEIDRGPVMAGALAMALLWPVIPAFILLARFMGSSPVLSQAEVRDRLAARDKRIAELEREAGITRPGRTA